MWLWYRLEDWICPWIFRGDSTRLSSNTSDREVYDGAMVREKLEAIGSSQTLYCLDCNFESDSLELEISPSFNNFISEFPFSINSPTFDSPPLQIFHPIQLFTLSARPSY